jgi:hypothetical protein
MALLDELEAQGLDVSKQGADATALTLANEASFLMFAGAPSRRPLLRASGQSRQQQVALAGPVRCRNLSVRDDGVCWMHR